MLEYPNWHRVTVLLLRFCFHGTSYNMGFSFLFQDIVLHHNSQALVLRSGLANGNSAATGDYSAAISNGAPIDLGHSTVSRLCEDVFFRLVTSGKFASLCKLLSENFYGLKIEKFLDFSLINLRMKENAYETTPTLFASDIQQVLCAGHFFQFSAFKIFPLGCVLFT